MRLFHLNRWPHILKSAPQIPFFQASLGFFALKGKIQSVQFALKDLHFIPY